MHEYAIGQNIVTAVLEAYHQIDPPPRRLKKAKVVAGGMHQIVPDYLVMAYEFLTRETELKGSRMDLSIQDVTGRCRDCEWEGLLQMPFFECGACKSRLVEVLSGMELYLDGLEVETDER